MELSWYRIHRVTFQVLKGEIYKDFVKLYKWKETIEEILTSTHEGVKSNVSTYSYINGHP